MGGRLARHRDWNDSLNGDEHPLSEHATVLHSPLTALSAPTTKVALLALPGLPASSSLASALVSSVLSSLPPSAIFSVHLVGYSVFTYTPDSLPLRTRVSCLAPASSVAVAPIFDSSVSCADTRVV